MNVFIVYAHPEPRSFGRALLDRSVQTLRSDGHQVVVSDLYAMGFQPVANGDDFTERRFPDALQYDRSRSNRRSAAPSDPIFRPSWTSCRPAIC